MENLPPPPQTTKEKGDRERGQASFSASPGATPLLPPEMVREIGAGFGLV